ncbi:MAG: hypothetical protein ILO10_04785 [Kiritimatiellae bacterium]|nr:hypothetical protein [Kiritimatiellia bacterium]
MKKDIKQAQKQTVKSAAETQTQETAEAARVRQPWSWVAVVSFLLIALTGVYVMIRASRLELAGDEWGFWEDSLKPGLEGLLTFQHQDPQSHFLLGVLSLPFMRLWPGDSLTAIRIPSVLAFFLYAWVGWRLGRRLKRNWLRVVLMLGWFGNAWVLEYFSQVRGYGLLVAFASLAYMGVIEAYDRRGGLCRQSLWSYIAILAAAAAMLSIMVFVFAFCVIAGLLILRYGLDSKASEGTEGMSEVHVGWRQRVSAAWEQSGFIVATGIAVGVFYMPRYLILKDHPAMQWGGESGFIHDTMASVVDTFPHYLPTMVTPYLPMIAWAVTGMMALNAVAVGISLWREQKRAVRDYLESPTILLLLLFAGIWVLSGVGHALAGVQYLVKRTTLFLWPLVVAQCMFAMDEAEGVWKWVVRGLNLAALAVALGVAVQAVNLDECEANKSMSHQSEIVRTLAKLAQESHGRPVVVGLTDPMKYTFGYYMEKVCGLKESPQTERNPVFKLFGDNIFIYSLNYALPDDAEWHWHPATTHYLLSEIFSHHPDPTLMDTNPVTYWQGMRAGIYRALPQKTMRGCEPGKCMICQYFRESASYQPPSQ